MARTSSTKVGRKSSGNHREDRKLTSLAELCLKEVHDLYGAEQMILKALPKMAKAASSPELQEALREHEEQTQTHVGRLEQVLEHLGERPKGAKSKGVAGLLDEGKEIMGLKAEPSVLDAAPIAAAQRVEHYEMAGYGCARTYARLMGKSEAADLLQETLEEEKAADRKLTEIAEHHVNPEAQEAGGEGAAAEGGRAGEAMEEAEEAA